MHIAIEGSPVRKGEGYRCASLYLKDGGQMGFYLPDEGVAVEELLQRENFLQEAEDLLVDTFEVRVNWSVPKFDLHDSLKRSDALQALWVTDACDVSKADFAPRTEQPAYVESVNQAARVKIDEEGVEAAAYTEVDTNAAAAPPQEMPEEFRGGDEDLRVRVCDYVAGMTDRFADQRYREHFVPSGWQGKR